MDSDAGTATTLPPSLFCSQCGRALSASELVTIAGASVCANCKPAFLRKLQEGAPAGTLRYKGFWIRFCAKVIDDILLYIVLLPFLIPFFIKLYHSMPIVVPGQSPDPSAMMANLGPILAIEGALWLLWVILFLGYNTLLLTKFQTTVGKLAIGAIVVTPEGNRIGWGKALARTAMELVNGLTLDIGYIIAAFDEKKRGLHDRVAGTVVVAK